MRDNTASVAGVRFRNAGKIFYFHAAGMRLEVGEYVIVETTRGPEIARVVIAPEQVVVNELGREELKPILRLATEGDIRRAEDLRLRAEELLPEARRLGEELQFPARIDAAEFTLDGRRLTFTCSSDERFDHREFVRRSAAAFHARVDVRQVGARDRAKLAGGYGICGRELCCSSWLATFPSISIRMAKEQELPLNPQKISGLCGRLLCCLSYEEEGYKEMRKSLPKIGQRCSTPTGEGKVIGVNILRRQVTLYVEGAGRVEVPDRDLGTVVRWDTSSKSGTPPPSISRVDAIAQGLIQATEEDLREHEPVEPDWLEAPESRVTGRGRLPGGGPRREMKARPERTSGAPAVPPARGARGRVPEGEQPQAEQPRENRRRRGRGNGEQAAPPREGRREQPRRQPTADLPAGRTFQRADPGGPPAPSRPSQGAPRQRPQRPPEDSAAADGVADAEGSARSPRRHGRRGRGNPGDGQSGTPQGE